MKHKHLRLLYNMYVKSTTCIDRIRNIKMTPKKWLICAGVLFIVYMTYDANRDKPINRNVENNSEYNDLSSVAQFYADKVLPQNLKHPDGWEYERQAMNKQDSVTYHFTAVVLAKNGFGVRSRLMYNFVIQYIGTKEDSYATDKNNLPSNWKIVSNELVE